MRQNQCPCPLHPYRSYGLQHFQTRQRFFFHSCLCLAYRWRNLVSEVKKAAATLGENTEDFVEHTIQLFRLLSRRYWFNRRRGLLWLQLVCTCIARHFSVWFLLCVYEFMKCDFAVRNKWAFFDLLLLINFLLILLCFLCLGSLQERYCVHKAVA